MRGEDISVRITVSFEEAAFGVKKDITYNRIQKCDTCHGSGAAEGTKAETCSACGGSGQRRDMIYTYNGIIQPKKEILTYATI